MLSVLGKKYLAPQLIRRGACQGIEDAAALGVLFSKDFQYTQNVEEGLKMYEQIRKSRAERVQYCSVLATEDIRERIGFSSLVSMADLQ